MNRETVLRYNAPAESFNSALPVGNGRIGGMIFGGAADELIRLNEDSFWSGSLRHRINPDSQVDSPFEVRDELFAENADRMRSRHYFCAILGTLG